MSQTKPWEEEWSVDDHDSVWVLYKSANDSGTVANFDRHGDPETVELSKVDIARARLAALAPKMANLLARILDEHGAYMPSTAGDIEDVLREAGVLE